MREVTYACENVVVGDDCDSCERDDEGEKENEMHGGEVWAGVLNLNLGVLKRLYRFSQSFMLVQQGIWRRTTRINRLVTGPWAIPSSTIHNWMTR